jgi:hypothetical protein
MISKFLRALSCYIPLFLIFLLKNGYVLLTVDRTCQENAAIIKYNRVLLLIWIALILLSYMAVRHFREKYLDNEGGNTNDYWLKAAENTTAEYYFTYFSLFVISFCGVDATNPEEVFDMIILAILAILMLWVYIANDMYYINPVLNLIGYRAFSVTVEFESNGEKRSCTYKVFSRDNLCVCDKNQVVWVRKTEKYDFAVCGIKKENDEET